MTLYTACDKRREKNHWSVNLSTKTQELSARCWRKVYLNEVPFITIQLGYQEGTLDLVEHQNTSVLVHTFLSVGFVVSSCATNLFNGAGHD